MMKKTILCVDDIQTNLFIVQSVIEDMAEDLYNIILADSANKALEILLKQKIDLVLMDVMMPDIDGLEATRMIKSNKKTKDIPVIFVTAKNDDETINECYSVGGDDYVSKPFNHVELLARMAFHLNSKEKDLQLLEEKEYTQNILDLQENLILVASSKKDLTANQALLNFYGEKNLYVFQSKYNSVCDTFVEDDEYFSLADVPSETTWVDEVMRLSADKDVLVKIAKEDSEYIFTINAVHFKKHYIITFTDITQVSQLSSEYKYEASYDSLTSIYNRNMFHRVMDTRIAAARSEQTSFIFVIFDIDFFKKVNDTYGHLVGDDILKDVVKVVQSNIRDKDVFARWGGEEFVLAFDVSLKKGLEIAENLRRYIETHNFNSVDVLTCSFGLTEFKPDDTLDSMIKRADNALYEAKSTGRNKVCKSI